MSDYLSLIHGSIISHSVTSQLYQSCKISCSARFSLLYIDIVFVLFCFVLVFFFFFFFPFLVRTMISSTHLTMTSKPPSATYHLHHSKPHQLYLCSTKHHRPPKRQNLLSCVYFLHKFCYSWFTWVPLPTFFSLLFLVGEKLLLPVD